jgi:MFS family permease
VNFIFYFGTTFFKQVGITIPFVVSIITATGTYPLPEEFVVVTHFITVNVVSTPISFWTIERFGRRAILLGGAIGMGVSQLIVAIVGTVTSHTASDTLASQPFSDSASLKVLITFVCIFIFFFASTWGPCGWAVIGEIFPVRVRSKGVALSTASNWLWNFIIAFCTPYLVDQDQANLGTKVFFIWGGTCILCALFAYFCVYETKGLSLEEVDRMMAETTARMSKKWDSGVRVNDEETARNSGSPKLRPTARPMVTSADSED